MYILDGTSIDERMHESQKGHQKGFNANFKILHDVSGELKTYAGPFSGRLPDNQNFNEWDLDTLRVSGFCDLRCITKLSFPHGRHELLHARPRHSPCDGKGPEESRRDYVQPTLSGQLLDLHPLRGALPVPASNAGTTDIARLFSLALSIF